MIALLANIVMATQTALPADPVIEQFEVDQVPFTVALDALIAKAQLPRANYKVVKSIEGNVTVSFKKVSFQTILRNLAIQVDAFAEFRDGKTLIFYKNDGPSRQRITAEFERTDTSLIFKKIFEMANLPYRIDVQKFRHSGLNLDFEDVPFESVLNRLTIDLGLRYRVEKGLYIFY